MIKSITLERYNRSMGGSGPFYKYTISDSGKVKLTGSPTYNIDQIQESWEISHSQFRQIVERINSINYFKIDRIVAPVVTTGSSKANITVERADGTSHSIHIGFCQYFSKITHNQLNSWLRESFDPEVFELSHSDLDPLVALNCLAYDIDNIVVIHKYLDRDLVNDSVFIE